MSAAARGLAAAAALGLAFPALAAKGLPPGERVDLNRATVSELMRVPGIGQKKAQAIVALRQRQPFRRVEDVLAVKGLGPAWLAKVKASLVVSPGGPPPPAAAPKR
ncbi:MAG TPA: helix-hairpin-helix domain-containing protein [Anaeromyxobacter sp.]